MSEPNQQRTDVQQVLDRIVSDPTYRTQLLDDPAQALVALGLRDSDTEPEVAGFMMCRVTCEGTKGNTCTKTCSVTY